MFLHHVHNLPAIDAWLSLLRLNKKNILHDGQCLLVVRLRTDHYTHTSYQCILMHIRWAKYPNSVLLEPEGIMGT